MRRMRWKNSVSDALTTMPPVTSSWPPRYLVVEWTTRSAPRVRGRWSMGLAQVLSQTHSAPADWAMDAISAMLVILSSGLDGVSTQIMRVLG